MFGHEDMCRMSKMPTITAECQCCIVHSQPYRNHAKLGKLKNFVALVLATVQVPFRQNYNLPIQIFLNFANLMGIFSGEKDNLLTEFPLLGPINFLLNGNKRRYELENLLTHRFHKMRFLQ